MIVRGIDRIGIALVIVGSIALAGEAQAETYVYTGAWSHHIGSEYDYNEDHNLLALQHDDWIGGYFKNSIRKDTFFVGRTVSWDVGQFDVGAIVGAMHGYTRCGTRQSLEANKRVCPMFAPAVSYTANSFQPTVLVMGNAVAFSVKWEL